MFNLTVMRYLHFMIKASFKKFCTRVKENKRAKREYG